MGLRSKVFAAQDALFALLDGGNYPGRVMVSLGAPLKLEVDHVWVAAGVDEWPLTYRVSGLGFRDETFTLRACVYSKRLGTITDARDRADELAEVVEDLVVAHHTLSGTVDLATVTRMQVEPAVDEDGRAFAVLITLSIECQAFVSSA